MPRLCLGRLRPKGSRRGSGPELEIAFANLSHYTFVGLATWLRMLVDSRTEKEETTIHPDLL
jgi:hypothetical protein